LSPFLPKAIAIQERIAKEQAEALLKKYRDRFDDIPE
jgi:ribosomal protein S17E